MSTSTLHNRTGLFEVFHGTCNYNYFDVLGPFLRVRGNCTLNVDYVSIDQEIKQKPAKLKCNLRKMTSVNDVNNNCNC